MMPARWGVFFMLPRFILNSAAPRSEAEDSNKRKAYPVSPKTGSAKTCPLNQRRPTGRRHGQHDPADAGLDDPARAPRAGHLAPVAAGVGDLARQLSSTALRSPARAMMIQSPTTCSRRCSGLSVRSSTSSSPPSVNSCNNFSPPSRPSLVATRPVGRTTPSGDLQTRPSTGPRANAGT